MKYPWFDWIWNWWSRGVHVSMQPESKRRPYTHADRYSKTVRDKRKARRKMANASRRRNR
jgi:hypothetical protein